MNLYPESSAVLAWLLGESYQEQVVESLRNAEHIVTSALTAVECARGLALARAMQRISRVEELAALRMLESALAGWSVHDVNDVVLEEARRAFPVAPVRTLDAIHLATVSRLHAVLPNLVICSLDRRVRSNAKSLGFALAPSSFVGDA